MSVSDVSDSKLKSFDSSSDEKDVPLREEQESDDENEPPPNKRWKITARPAVWAVVQQCSTYEKAKLYVSAEHPDMTYKSKNNRKDGFKVYYKCRKKKMLDCERLPKTTSHQPQPLPTAAEPETKRKRGRPRIHPILPTVDPPIKRKPGRPRRQPPPSLPPGSPAPKPKRKLGRPPKQP